MNDKLRTEILAMMLEIREDCVDDDGNYVVQWMVDMAAEEYDLPYSHPILPVLARVAIQS